MASAVFALQMCPQDNLYVLHSHISPSLMPAWAANSTLFVFILYVTHIPISVGMELSAEK